MSLPADQSSGGTPQSEVPELLERVKIVHFPVGNGDCTLIMIRGRDTSKARNWHAISFLIDTGSTGNFKKRWDAIWSEIKCGYDNLPEFYKAQAGLKPKLDYFIITHFDQDHANHAGTLLATLKKNRDEEKLDPVRSSSSSEWSWVDYMFIVDRLNGAIAPSDKKNFVNLYRKERAKYDYDEIYGVLPIEPDTDLLRISQTFDLANFEMVCVAANGVIGQVPKIRDKKPDEITPRKPEDLENDLGLAFVLRFGSFRFYVGGDLTGTEDPLPQNDLPRDKKKTFLIRNSMEVPLVNHLKSRGGTVPMLQTFMPAQCFCIITVANRAPSATS